MICSFRFLLIFLLVVGLFISASPQIRIDEVRGKASPSLNGERGLKMLRIVKETLEERYYDRNFKGIDIDAEFKVAAEKIKGLETNAEIFRVIAAVLLQFKDSHTRFYPPRRSDHIEYGFTIQMIGDKCFVVDVKKGSDAEKQGIKVGTRLIKIGQHTITRDSLWILNYFIYQLEPMPRLPLTLISDNGTERSLTLNASFKTLEQRKKERENRKKETRENPYKCVKVNAALTACQLKTFSVERNSSIR